MNHQLHVVVNRVHAAVAQNHVESAGVGRAEDIRIGIPWCILSRWKVSSTPSSNVPIVTHIQILIVTEVFPGSVEIDI